MLDPNINTMGGYLLYLSSIPFWVSRPITVLRHAIYGTDVIDPKGEFYIATDEQKNNIVAYVLFFFFFPYCIFFNALLSFVLFNFVIREARVFVIIYSLMALWSLYYGSTTLLYYWVIPTIIGQVITLSEKQKYKKRQREESINRLFLLLLALLEILFAGRTHWV